MFGAQLGQPGPEPDIDDIELPIVSHIRDIIPDMKTGLLAGHSRPPTPLSPPSRPPPAHPAPDGSAMSLRAPAYGREDPARGRDAVDRSDLHAREIHAAQG